MGDVDLVHLHVSERGSVIRNFILMSIASAFRRPVLLHTHGCEFHIFHDRLAVPFKLAVNWFIQASFLISLSHSWRGWYVKHCGLNSHNVFVLNNPIIFPAEIPYRKSHESIKLLFLGKIGHRKGVFDILNAFSKLSPDLRERAQLIFAGAGEVEALVGLAHTLDIHDQIVLPGWVDAGERDRLFAESDIFLLPSYNEGLPMSLLESMAWGIPPITTPVGGIPEIVIHKSNGLLIEPGNIEQIASAMEQLIICAEDRYQQGQAARESVHHLRVEKYIDSLLEIYSTITKSKNNLAEYQAKLSEKTFNI